MVTDYFIKNYIILNHIKLYLKKEHHIIHLKYVISTLKEECTWK